MKKEHNFTKLFLLILLIFFFSKIQGKVTVISVANFNFSPANVNVIIGDTIRWEWLSGNHTTTSLTIPQHAASWDELITAGNTDFEYVVHDTGVYKYKCTPHFGMGMVGEFTVSPSLQTTAKNITPFPHKITFFPNPVLNTVNITFNLPENKVIDFELIDITGKTILLGQEIIDKGLYFMSKLDLTGIPAGIYILKIYGRLEEGYIFHERIAKQ